MSLSQVTRWDHGKCHGILVKLKVKVQVKGRGLREGQEQRQSQGPSPESKFGSDPDKKWHPVSGPYPHLDLNAWHLSLIRSPDLGLSLGNVKVKFSNSRSVMDKYQVQGQNQTLNAAKSSVKLKLRPNNLQNSTRK